MSVLDGARFPITTYRYWGSTMLEWKMGSFRGVALTAALILANLGVGGAVAKVYAADEEGTSCCSTCVCWCARSGDVVALGVCSSLGTGVACGPGNTADGKCHSCPS